MAFLGEDILPIAAAHVGERYVLGARAPVLNPNWRGPWDCAEFATWCAYQTFKILFGVEPDDPRKGDAFTGYWWADSERLSLQIPVAEALATPGAFLLRRPQRDLIGHIAISLGDGRLVEAASAKLGVVLRANTPDRRWDVGVELPGVQYSRGAVQPWTPPVGILQVTHPYMRSAEVAAVQRALSTRGYDPGTVDGIYGELAEAAVITFQSDRGLIVDGEVGRQTAEQLGLQWPIVPMPADQAVLTAAASAPAIKLAALPPIVSPPLPVGQAFQFTVQKRGSQYFSKESTNSEEVLLGRDTSYTPSGRQFKGIAHRNSVDLAEIKPYGEYSRFQEEAQYGLWAHVVWPSVTGESDGLYARVNTYDSGFFTFGLYQLAAHTPGENLAELFRAFLALADAPAYFPDLTLVGGKVHRLVGGQPQSLETAVQSNGLSTSGLALYLNPDTGQVDPEETVAAARLVYWARQSVAARAAQVSTAIAIAKRKLQAAHGKLDLSGRPLAQCIWVSDILHQGRGTYARIKSALNSASPIDGLKGIGSFTGRTKTVDTCINELGADGTLAEKTYEDLWLLS